MSKIYVEYQNVLNWTYELFGQMTELCFYILPNCIRNHTEFENHKTILTCLNAKIVMFKMDVPVLIIDLFCFSQGVNC